jgi:hypothetical protein
MRMQTYVNECECRLWKHTWILCHHLIAVFAHIRLDKIPGRYLLLRYSKNPVTDPTFNRKDYIKEAPTETSIEYRRTLLYNEAMKVVNKGCFSDKMFPIALAAFKEVNTRMETDENHTSNTSERSADADAEERAREGDSGDISANENTRQTDAFADIQPPPMAKTKGSKSKKTAASMQKVNVAAPARPEPELDEHGKPKGTRLCSNCNKIDGQNTREALVPVDGSEKQGGLSVGVR